MNVIKIAAVFAGSVLGAGFASGQELMVFFSRFGRNGIWGALLSGILIALFGALICGQSYNLTKKDYITYLKFIFKEPLAKTVYLVTQIFLCISFSIMISGSAELLYVQYNIPRFLGEVLTLLVCGWCFANKVTGLTKLNLYLTPIMITGISFVAVMAVFKTQDVFAPLEQAKNNFIVNACLYMSYNILTSAAVLAPTVSIAKNKNQAMLGGATGGIILALVMILCTLSLLKFDSLIINSQFPMLIISQEVQKLFGLIYPPLIYMAMLTTAVSSGFCVTEVLQKTGMGSNTAAIVLCLAAIPLSMVKFSTLIKNCYMFFGILGLMLIVGIIVKNIKKKRK